MKKVLVNLNKKWWPILLIVSIALFALNVLLFYPGYMSPDSLWQLCQAKGDCELTTWHPVSMAMLWSFLMSIAGGRIGTLLVFQITLLWSSLFLLSNYIWQKTKNKKYSLLPLVVGVLPFVWGLSGVVWKDVHMAFSLLASVSLILTATLLKEKHKYLKYFLYILILVSIFYAISVRTNGFVAALPITYFFVVSTKLLKKQWKIILATIIIIASGYLISFNLHRVSGVSVKKDNADVSMYLYDIVNIYPAEKLAQKAPASLQDILLKMSNCSYNNQSNSVDLAWWSCISVDEIEELSSSKEDYFTLRAFWLKAVAKNPIDYIFSKLATTNLFLFPSTPTVAPSGVAHSEEPLSPRENTYGMRAKVPAGPTINRSYTNNFGVLHFSFLFKAWFWLLSSTAVLLVTIKNNRFKKYKQLVIALSISSILYILSLLLGSLTSDYRYVYWPAIATTISVLLLFIGRSRVKKR